MALPHYGTSAGLSAYAADRGVTLASGDVDDALVRASFALDAAYVLRWIGAATDYTQLLAWPRSAEWPDGSTISGIPLQVEYAAYEYAIQELRTPNSTSPTVVPGRVKTRSRVEGAIDVSYSLGGDPIAAMVPVNTVVEGLLFYLAGSRMILPGVLVV